MICRYVKVKKIKYPGSFNDQVFDALKRIPKGKITTYKKIAEFIRSPKAYRAVGTTLSKNQCLVKIPCHRVVKSNGQVGGYVKGIKQKVVLLNREGIKVVGGRVMDFLDKLYIFK